MKQMWPSRSVSSFGLWKLCHRNYNKEASSLQRCLLNCNLNHLKETTTHQQVLMLGNLCTTKRSLMLNGFPVQRSVICTWLQGWITWPKQVEVQTQGRQQHGVKLEKLEKWKRQIWLVTQLHDDKHLRRQLVWRHNTDSMLVHFSVKAKEVKPLRVMFQMWLWRASCQRSASSPAASNLAARRPSSGSGRTWWCTSSSGTMVTTTTMTMTTTTTAAKSTSNTSRSLAVPQFSHTWYPAATPHWSSGRAASRTEARTGVTWAPRRANTMRRSSWRWKVSLEMRFDVRAGCCQSFQTLPLVTSKNQKWSADEERKQRHVSDNRLQN